MKPVRSSLFRRGVAVRYSVVGLPLCLLVMFMFRAQTASIAASSQSSTLQASQLSPRAASRAGAAADALGLDTERGLQEELAESLQAAPARQQGTPSSKAPSKQGGAASSKAGGGASSSGNLASMLIQEEEEAQETAAIPGSSATTATVAQSDGGAPAQTTAAAKPRAKQAPPTAAAKPPPPTARRPPPPLQRQQQQAAPQKAAAAAGPVQQQRQQGQAGSAPVPAPSRLFWSRPAKDVDYARSFGTAQDDDKRKVLRQLGRCMTLQCLITTHDKLAGRTPFNLPHFFIVGWSKCATTSIHAHLSRHPQVLAPPLKEPHFFTACTPPAGPSCRVKTQSAYLRQVLRLEEAAAVGLEAATYEASTDYILAGEPVALRLYRLFPWLRVVIMMRDPIARAASLHKEEGHGGKRCPEKASLYDCLRPTLAPGPGNRNYSVPLEGWLRTFPRDQIHVVQYEELAERPAAVTAALKIFLGLDPAAPQSELPGSLEIAKGAYEGEPMRREQYLALVREARLDGQRSAALLSQYGVADGEAFLQRWEMAWRGVLEDRCDASGQCLVGSH